MKTCHTHGSPGCAGFTLIELLLGSTLLLIMIVGTLALYDRSNKASVDQTQFSEVQHDVRSAMYFMSRDSRMAGVGLISDVSGYAVEGQDAFGPAPEASDSLRLMGNFDDPLDLRIRDYNGSSATAFLYDYALENEPYDCPGYYENRTVFIMSTRCPGCYAFRFIALNSMHGCGTGTAHVDFQPGQAPGINPPGGLSDTLCDDSCWIDAIITTAQIKLYWLDQTGDPTDYPSLNLTVGQDGYLGIPNVLYMSTNTDVGVAQHMPLAMNIENIQFEYNGDFDHDGNLDGFRPWDNANWTIQASDDEATRDTKRQLLARISQVRIQILGRTPHPYVSVSKTPVTDVQLYRRPTLSNSAGAAADDWRRRFLLESTATIRNNALIIYNEGQR